MAGINFAHRARRCSGSPAVPEQAQVSAQNQRASLAQERLDGVAGRRVLPTGAIEAVGLEQDLRDILLGRAVAKTIDGAQHALCAGALLRRYPCVGRNGAAMDRGEEAVQRFEPAESIEPERDDGGGGRGDRRQHLQPFAIAEIEQRVNAFQVGRCYGRGRKLSAVSVPDEAGWRRREDDDAGVVLRQPEY